MVIGIDGTGKSTVCKELLKQIPMSKLTKEPYKYRVDPRLDPHDKLITFLYDRMYHMDLVSEWLQQYHVISDRGFYCNMAYQAAEGIQIHNIFLMQPRNLILPTHVVYLDADIGTSIERIKKRGEIPPSEKTMYAIKCNYEYIKDRYIMPPIKLIDINTDNKSIPAIVSEILKQLLTY
ncbi:MAG TPA: AAA family ATPase [Methanospirillum sp.]|uniref:hypothetical protein n=1 Tax=Methanospirillum sp. TaxID=45200 RepID=UPI002CB8730A|nr:hypothetical protein [Methanospirillum sp.]HOJ97290.1 AAA family ATPase [Methanospirillum sp.]HPP77783.1 AAA family ATPase [Methanospirillum sp.]